MNVSPPVKSIKKSVGPSAEKTPRPRHMRHLSEPSGPNLPSYDSGDEEIDALVPTTTSQSGKASLIASMYKRRGGFGRKADNNWIKRTLTLEGSVLCYYEEEDLKSVSSAHKPRGRLNLTKEETVAEMHTKKTDAPTEFLLTVNIYLFHGGKRKWELSCANQDQQLQWYSAIRKFDGNKKSSTPGKGLDENYHSASLPVHKKQNGLYDSSKPNYGSLESLDDDLNIQECQTNLYTADVFIAFGVINVSAYVIKFATETTHILIAFMVLNIASFCLLQKTAVETVITSSNADNPRRLRVSSKNMRSLVINDAGVYTFKEKVPAGTTLKRAPIKKGSSLEKIIQEHGDSSVEAVRAYAASSEMDYDEFATHCFWNMKSSEFNLRIGPNYKKNKQKAPSIDALYDVIHVDFVRSETVLQQTKDGFKAPTIPGLTDLPSTGHPHVPPMFVVNAWLPTEEPSLLKKTQDGVTYICVIHYVITQKTLDELKDFQNASPAVKLFAEWCEKAEHDFDFRSRLKFMGAVVDIEKLGLPSFISSQNGRPCLITKSGTFSRHQNYIEMSINIRQWAYLAKKALHILQPKFPNFVLNIGITIEGRKDEELPEILLGGCRLIRIDPEKAVTDASVLV